MKQLLFEDTIPVTIRTFEIMVWLAWGTFAGAIMYRDGSPQILDVVARADNFSDPFVGGSLGFIVPLVAIWLFNWLAMPRLKARYLEPAQ